MYKPNHVTEGYDIGQICLNGHVINGFSTTMPEFNQTFCQECGEKTVTECCHCNKPIRGSLGGVVSTGEMPAPLFCVYCGKPFPWLARRLDAARLLAEELEDLSPEDRMLLGSSLDNLVRETPMTEVAIVRFKKVIRKLAKPTAEAFKSVLYSVLTEAAKKGIWS
jgi:hypothetical protein